MRSNVELFSTEKKILSEYSYDNTSVKIHSLKTWENLRLNTHLYDRQGGNCGE